jgi:hypothetical protein
LAAAKGRAVLMLVVSNQLEDRDGAPDLVLMPPIMVLQKDDGEHS